MPKKKVLPKISIAIIASHCPWRKADTWGKITHIQSRVAELNLSCNSFRLQYYEIIESFYLQSYVKNAF